MKGPLSEQPHFALEAGFEFLPLDDENLDDVVGVQAGESLGAFTYLTPILISLLRTASKMGSIAYVETDYFGGTGRQGAIVFSKGDVTLGPLTGESGAINEALTVLGAPARSERQDAFATIGLDRHRFNEDYREEEARD